MPLLLLGVSVVHILMCSTLYKPMCCNDFKMHANIFIPQANIAKRQTKMCVKKKKSLFKDYSIYLNVYLSSTPSPGNILVLE